MRGSIVLVLATLSCAPAAAADSFSGIARAMDGDSLMVGEREVRLFGIDAPEFGQTCTKGGQPWACGEAAADQLSKLVTGRKLFCQAIDTDENGRTVARCTAGAVDVNRAMVSSGYATAYRHYSADYSPDEEQAKAAKRGIWAGSFKVPGEHRRSEEAKTKRLERQERVSAIGTTGSGCVIKGNRGSNGWIYHLPGMPYYDRTKAEEMFCSEGEAQAAGYRRAKVR